jgi:hypothetical protein
VNAEETVIALRVLSAAYGHVEPSPDTVELWGNVFAGDDATLVLQGIREWVLTETYWPTPADMRRYMRQARIENQTALPPTRTCDGTGWREIEEGLIPCNVCNPVLAEVFADRHKLDRWRGGTPADKLVNTDMTVVPVAYCQPDTVHEDPNDPIVPPRIGRRIAWNAHVADAADRGVAPMNEDVFMRLLGVRAMSDASL